MGKHDKREAFVLATNVMPDDFYKARIKTLEKENQKLATELEEANKAIDFLMRKVDSTESHAVREVVDLEKALLNAARAYWGED